MKIGVVFLSGFIFLTSLTLAQNYPHIEELRGLEDSLGNTQLFYRYVFPPSGCWSKSIYHLDLDNNSDTIFISDFGYELPPYSCYGTYVYDYKFLNNDFSKFIYGGYELWIDPIAVIGRYDTTFQLPWPGGITELDISDQNSNLIYAGFDLGLYKSTDGGYEFIQLNSSSAIDKPIISLNENDDSQIFGINYNNLVRTEDEGSSYIIVDNSQWDNNSELFYDADGSHIYGLSNYYIFSTQSYNSNIFVSNDNGNPFTWNSIVSEEIPLKFAFDENQTGEIYYSAGKQIFKSTDYGTTFSLYKTLDRKITGLYKKSGTNILYASTPLKIYEITPTNIQVIKSLPIPDEVLNFYPMEIGNKWVYDEITVVYDPYPNVSHNILVKEVLGDTTAPNGKNYFKVNDETLWESFVLERADTSDGKIYRYYQDQSLPEGEYPAYDLLAELGDTVEAYRMGFNTVMFTTMYNQTTFEKWGLSKSKKVFQEYTLHPPIFSLTQDVGLDSIYFYFDFGDTWITLKGCIIDGVVYGDTTVVSVDEENPELPTEFSLSQNYPNPFNPRTKIQYAIGSLPTGQAGRQYVSLKVYDILGKEIATLVNEEKLAGEYEVEFNASLLPSGIYFYQLNAGSFVQTKKMILLR